jgi:hypothetical protein
MRIPSQSAGVKRTMIGARQALKANQQVHPQEFVPGGTICPDLLNQEFQYPRACNAQGVLGTKNCTRTCDINRAWRFLPLGGIRCVITGSTCTPEVCGPCQTPSVEDVLTV